jgi:hypothetical protein
VLDRSILRTFELLTTFMALPSAAAVSGEAVYQRRCASCDDDATGRTPPREEREAVANFLGVQRPDTPLPRQAYCADRGANIGGALNSAQSSQWLGWSADFWNTRYTSTGGIALNQWAS